MSSQAVRETLVARTIEVIATEGLDKTTTKAIVDGTGINEAYIYRHFSSKDDLLANAFTKLDNELAEKMLQYVEVMYVQDLDYETRCRAFFVSVWKFLLSDKQRCVTFVRYYYSPYFLKYSMVDHVKRYAPLIKKFEDAFIEEADIWMILNHILNVMLDFAIKVHSGLMPNEDIYAEHVFRVLYASVKQYFKRAKENDYKL